MTPDTQKWKARSVDATIVRRLQRDCGLGYIVAQTLVSRGFNTAAQVEAFLAPSLLRDWSDPNKIPGMTAAVDAVEAAIRADKRILIFGDFDLDGVSATAIMVLALRALGNEPGYLIPNRIDEGYGLTQAALMRICETAPDLLITVDCGISAHDEVNHLLEKGIDVVVTDHHETSGAVPLGIPVTDPKLDGDSPAGILAGAGVALKLVDLLGARFGKPQLWLDFIDLAALGTIADIMPLIGENRALVAEGLRKINLSPRRGIAASLALCRKDAKNLSASELSFGLIPRLNAAGRMGDATIALELLLSEQPEQSAAAPRETGDAQSTKA